MGKRLGIPHGVSYGFGIALRWRAGHIYIVMKKQYILMINETNTKQRS